MRTHVNLPSRLRGRDQERLQRWGNRSEPILFLLSIPASSAIVGMFRLANLPDIHWTIIMWASCSAIFATEFVVRLWLTEHRIRFAKTHKLDVLTVVLPLLRCKSPGSMNHF